MMNRQSSSSRWKLLRKLGDGLSIQLLGKRIPIAQDLIHNLGTQVDLRCHLLLDALDVAKTSKEQINILGHAVPMLILLLR